MSETAKGVRTVHAVRHLSDILRCVSKSPVPIRINELARQVGLDKSSVSRLVSSLEQERLLQRSHENGIRLGIGLLALAAPLMRDFGLSTRVRPSLEELAKVTGETVNLSVWSGTESVSIVQALGPNAVTHFATPGRTNPAHCTASGKMLLAVLPQEDVERILSGELTRYTERTVTDADALRRQLAEIRARGYALNDGEFSFDVCAVSSAVFDMDGSVVGVVTVTVPAYRFDEAKRADIIAATLPVARDLSEQFGYRPESYGETYG